ncbi:hypothetical protein [Thalassovita taeanensis]|uniref:Uncharacterized protein n=1 Tax=Thalassovita taeanensis TaxID=657014 RepID=A0A1H9HRK3_9RHOB|nr:hypothetical protein [Thalassovita taeanensis]SEQ64961.1 hypothetical protein SAMN04488092_11052 [Thalassovita taeanensis]
MSRTNMYVDHISDTRVRDLSIIQCIRSTPPHRHDLVVRGIV